MSKRPHPDTVIPLDSKKQVTVRKFNNINLVDIREFYVDKATQEKKPGKKGISLTQDVWNKLMSAREEIDEALAELGGKRIKTQTSETSESQDTKPEKETEIEKETKPEADTKETSTTRSSKVKSAPTVEDSLEEE